MALYLGSNDVLYRLACECEDVFEQLQEAFLKAEPQSSDIEQCTEFQQRFSIWAAYLGVFAQKSQCLDTRLQNFPDLQDLATRLLDILRCSLHQYKDEISNRERDQASISSEQAETSSRPPASLAAIDNTLARLNRLGVTIRQSSQDRIHIRAEKSTAHLDLTLLKTFCSTAVETLYPNAHQHLKDYLKESMITRYKKMIHHNSRYMKLRAPRELRRKLSPISEMPNNELQTDIPVIQQAEIAPAAVDRSGVRVLAAFSQSDLSSVNIQQIRGRLKPPDEASTKFHQTSSVQVNQSNYPRPPIPNKKGDIFTCEWCSEPLNKKALSESDWRRHIDRDLKPYICLAEGCQDSHPVYSTLDEWYNHMSCHDRRWYQQIYLSPTWVCTICEFDPAVYSDPQALYSHLQESHLDDYTNEQLRVISQQSKMTQTRAWDNCLLCCFKVEEEDVKSTSSSLEQEDGIFKQNSFKRARKMYSMKHPGHLSSDDSDSSDISSDLDPNTLRQRLRQTEGHSKTITSHIAVHLQVLMLLTLRFAALQKDDKNFVDDDLESDCVEFDDENSSLRSDDSGKFSDIDFRRGFAMEDRDDGDGSGAANKMDNDVMGDDIPDTDLSLDDIPRQYDDLIAENDAFLKKVVESGAWQSWKDEPKEHIRHRLDDYTVAWICATHTEYNAARAFFDDVHLDPACNRVFGHDYMLCTLGQIGRHNIILVAASSNIDFVGVNMVYQFPNIRFYLLVGIGGGAPSARDDIRLGDVIVGCNASSGVGGIYPYNFEKSMAKKSLIPTESLAMPPRILQEVINSLRLRYEMQGSLLKEAINTRLDKSQGLREKYKRPETDRLYRSEIVHPSNNDNDCAVVCSNDPSCFVQRPERREDIGPMVHYGIIATANKPMKDALARDEIARIKNILCFETEAAGFGRYIPSVVIRGISDYSDSHNNQDWQSYAAMAAAAYAKDLLCQVSPEEMKAARSVRALPSWP